MKSRRDTTQNITSVPFQPNTHTHTHTHTKSPNMKGKRQNHSQMSSLITTKKIPPPLLERRSVKNHLSPHFIFISISEIRSTREPKSRGKRRENAGERERESRCVCLYPCVVSIREQPPFSLCTPLSFSTRRVARSCDCSNDDDEFVVIVFVVFVVGQMTKDEDDTRF